MAFTYVQSNAGGSTSPVVIAYLSNVAAGNLAVAAAYWNDAAATCSLAKTAGTAVVGTWNAIGSPQTGTGLLAAWRLQMFWALITSGGSCTITATVSSAVDAALALHEYTCAATPSVDGTPAYSTFTGSTTVTTGSVTTTAASDLLFCSGVASFAATGAGAGFAARQTTNFGSNITEDDVDGGAAGPVTATWTTTNLADDNITGLVAFKDVSAADTGLAWIRA